MAFLLSRLKKIYIQAKQFHTDRKLVVIESDDWGSIRMPSKAVFEKLQLLGDSPEKDAFLSNDCLESEEDLLPLYDVLCSVSDCKGNHPIFTMNFAMANPDFEKIDYKKGIYKYEPFYQTYSKYYGKNKVLDILKDGCAKKLILPQLHCREHLNVGRWMRDLKQGKKDALLAFENKTIGIGASFCKENNFGYMDAFNTDCSSEEQLAEILEDAIKIFNQTFGFLSKTFVASCFVWSDGFEKTLKKNGIDYLQSSAWQQRAVGKNGKYKLKRKLRYTGQVNKNKQIYSVRNCLFEPAFKQNPQESVLQCLNSIESAFNKKSPAVIGSHRFNYIGSINNKNSQNNLAGLKELLQNIVQKYPDVEFVSSVELFDIMSRGKK